MSTEKLKTKREDGKIYSHIRKKWLVETPEELVRQEFLCILVNEYGYKLEQIDEELEITGRGSGHSRADFVIWKSEEDRKNNKSPLIIVECKSDNVVIKPNDYWQGDNYARLTNAKFFITHNSNETKYWKVIHENMPKSIEEIENIPNAQSTDKDIEELISKLKVFKENEFADLLHKCHSVIRNREKKDPAEAFDEIAKILFTKGWVEKEFKSKQRRENIFSVEFLEAQLGDNPLNVLFDQAKIFYRSEGIFKDNEKINLKYETGKEIVKLLEKYNLSDTSGDIKGIAFERFLGKTFRGEIGQFFTPRTIVEFIVHFINPKEGEKICDPACGSGGFLIRVFEVIKNKILSDIDNEYKHYKSEIESLDYSDEERAKLLSDKYEELKKEIDKSIVGSRFYNLANKSIYGCDANERMAKTSKMNMIMHGDGYGGIYHSDGFINYGGIFEEQFDVIVTNPPFGANVEPNDLIDASQVDIPIAENEYYERTYGDSYKMSHDKMKSAIGKPIISLYDLPKKEDSKIKTEILFIERCLNLLKQGGRMGIVLPEGIFNNSSTEYVREFCEERSKILGVVSLPQETFYSSGADVKCSILFLQKFTDKELELFEKIKEESTIDINKKYDSRKKELDEIINHPRFLQRDFLKDGKKYSKEEKMKATEKAKDENEKLKQLKLSAKTELKNLEKTILEEIKILIKTKMDYNIFLYDAEKVGITATGDVDKNELYPNENKPDNIEYTAIELYEQYQENSSKFAVMEE